MKTGARRSLDDAFDPKANSLNALRLLFASLVLVAHSFNLRGLPPPPVGPEGLGDFAVDGFFVVSGFLITGSRLRSRTVRSYAWRRFLRLYPGMWVNIAVTVLVILPIGLKLTGGSVTAGGVANFVGWNAVLPRQEQIAGAFAHSHFPNFVNGSLWTLIWEIGGYVALGVLGSLDLLRRRGVTAGLLALWTVLALARTLGFGPLQGFYQASIIRFGLLFLAGACVWLLRDRLPAGPLFAALMTLVLVVSLVASDLYPVIGAFPLAYLAIWLGARLPLARLGVWANREQADDISYGTYIYGYPIQQLLLAAFGGALAAWPFALLSFAVTLPVAFASWRLVEAPAMRWGASFRRRTVAQQEPAV